MTDLSHTIAPKSDQLNADDLIGRNMTVTITRVSGNEGNPDQPVNIFFEGDNGKPYRPCKSMRRVLVQIWGKDGASYTGRSMTLYRDPEVQFGGMKVGGIRISHMSHIDAKVTMALTATRANRKPYTVQPLKSDPSLDDARKAAWQGTDGFRDWWRANPDKHGAANTIMTELKGICAEADKQIAETHSDDDPFDSDDPAPTEDEMERAMAEARAESDRAAEGR